MALSSSSTISDAYAQYKDNLRWQGDLTKAANLLEAIRFLQCCRPEQIAAETGVSMRFSSLENLIKQLESVIDATSTDIDKSQFTRGEMRLY